MSDALMWPTYAHPSDLDPVEAVPLSDRGLPETTYEALVRAARLWPDRVAVSVMPDAEHWRETSDRTYTQLLADVHRTANLMLRLGATRNTAIALLSPNCDDLLTATLAAELAGIAAPINGDLVGDHVRRLLELSGARILMCAAPELDARAWNTAVELDAEGALDAVVVLRPTGRQIEAPALRYAQTHVMGAEEDLTTAVFDGVPPVASDLAALFHTGGTTGVPKLAAHTHANQVIDAWMVAVYSGGDPEAAVFAGLPLFHVNALIVTTIAPLLRGQRGVWAGPLGYRDLHLYANYWKIVEHHGIGAMSGVPTVYAVLATCPVDADISTLRNVAVGAAPLPPSVAASFLAATGVHLAQGYGLTEATCATSRSFPDAPRPGTVGQRMPYQRVKAVRVEDDGTWTDLVAGQPGLLVISGPTVFAGYVTGRTGTGYVLDPLGKVVDGWLDTGDLGIVDEDGYIRLTGREKDLVIRGGHNIDPATVEDALLTHPEVTAAGVVGEPDLHAGEVPVGFVTLAPGATTTSEELVQWASDRVTERAAAPRRVTVVDAIPVTAVGKPFKPALRTRATHHALADALASLVPVESITVDLVDGEVAARVVVPDVATEKLVSATLSGFSVNWVIEVGS